MGRGRDFSDLAYNILINDKSVSLKEVAQEMDLSYASLHARIHNKVLFSADEIRLLIRLTPTNVLADYLLEPSGMIAVSRETVDDDDDADSIFRRFNHLAIETGNVLEAVEAAMVDNKLDHRDKVHINAKIIEAERSLASLKVSLGLSGN